MNFKVKKIIGIFMIGLTIIGSAPVMASTLQNQDTPQVYRPRGEIVGKGLKIAGTGLWNAYAWTQSSYGYAQTSISTRLVGSTGMGTVAKTTYNADGWAQVNLDNTNVLYMVTFASHNTLDESASTINNGQH